MLPLFLKMHFVEGAEGNNLKSKIKAGITIRKVNIFSGGKACFLTFFTRTRGTGGGSLQSDNISVG